MSSLFHLVRFLFNKILLFEKVLAYKSRKDKHSSCKEFNML
jgi:hypothetical protein